MKIPTRLAAMALLTAAALTACGREPSPPKAEATPTTAAEPASGEHLPPGIDWYPGDVDGAFASARADGKPLFLYWGAEWCPPCAQIKATIFNRREFQERSRSFVPVYLDGDTPGAQKLGERFGVVGYPSMILFRADGTEITRLPGNVDVARYASILDVALGDVRPITELLASARTGEPLSADDWRLLAYHSWDTDNERTMTDDQRLATFRTLSERCPSDVTPDCTRFLFGYLFAAAAATDSGQPAFDGLERAVARRTLLERMASPAVARANVANLSFGAHDVIGVLSDAGTAERAQLIAAWSAALDVLAAPGSPSPLSASERLNLLRSRVQLAQLEQPGDPLPPALIEQARREVAAVDAGTRDPYARQAAINAAANLFWEAGLDSDANSLLVAELGKSRSPYYFMLDLAELARKAGREQEAVDWLSRAYADADGPATRFQWGAGYLVGLLEMTPNDEPRIEKVGLQLISELGSSPDAFHQRTQMRLESLSDRLLEWGDNADRRAVLDRLRARTAEICRALPDGAAGRRNCEGFLRAASAHA
jgi:thiol-disulfide isomerase/thioredoxin